MNKRIFYTLAILLLSLLVAPVLPAAEANAARTNDESSVTNAHDPSFLRDYNDLITRINLKINQDKTSETDYAENIKEFDALLAKHKNAKPEDRVQLLLQKATLYMSILQLPEKALPVFQQIKNDFPSIQINGNTDDLISGLKEMIEKKNIREALIGVPFPDFNEKDLEGNDLSISKYKGKVVLLDFWATWCPPCVAAVPDVQKAYDKYHKQGFEVVGISLDMEKAALEKFIKQRKMLWPQVFAGNRFDNKLAIKYGVAFAPTTFLVGRDGKVIKQLAGTEDLDQEIANALKK